MQAALRHPYTVVIALALIVAVLPFVLPSTFHLRIAALVFIFSIAVVGLNLLMGFAGQVSLGHAGFFGIGAYAVAVGPTHLGIPSLAAFFIGIAVAGLLAYLVGRPILKLKGHYLAVATLGLGILIAMVFTNEARFTGGPDGMPVPRLELFGWRARTPIAWYWISGVTLVVAALIAVNLIESPRAAPSGQSTTAKPRRARSASMCRATSLRRSCCRRCMRRSQEPTSRCSTHW